MIAEMSLRESFAGRWGGSASVPAEDLERALEELHAQGRRAHPGVALPAADLAAYAGARVPADADALAAVRGLHAADLFLACGCALGLPAALGALDRLLGERLPGYLHRFRSTPEIEAETRQVLLERLLLPPAAGVPPRIAQYSGRGALDGWLRVAALRVALQIVKGRSDPAAAGDDDEAALARAVDHGDDPELRFLKESDRAVFVAAFREALAGAPPRTRALLDLAFGEGLTPARIGTLYGVHRTTVMRWIDEARAEILSATRLRLAERSGLSPAECDEVFRLVESQLDFTLSSLLEHEGRRAPGA